MEKQTPHPSPYVGLAPYSVADAKYFFGRENLQTLIINYLQAERLTLIYGTSGVGKSSVLRAGVVHRLYEQSQNNIARGGAPESCVVVFSDWGYDPVMGLLREVRTTIERDFPGANLDLAPQSESLAETLTNWSMQINCDLLIILDQFEEYLLYYSQNTDRFDKQFQEAVNDVGLRVNFMISMREDALAKLDRYRAGLPRLFVNRLRIEHLDKEAGRRAIEKPIEKYNQLSNGQKVSIDPNLIDQVLEEVATGYVGDSPLALAPNNRRGEIEAPYLQQVMIRLWDEDVKRGSGVLRLNTFQNLGGARSIVRSHLSSTINTLSRKKQKTAARIFRYLVTPSGSKIAQTSNDLAVYSGLPESDVVSVLNKLSDMRIVRTVAPPPDHPNDPRYEIFHDVLATPINNWWRDYEVNEKYKSRFLRLAMAALMVLFLVSVGLTVYAFQQGSVARHAEAVAKEQTIKADEQKEIAEERLKQLEVAENQLRINNAELVSAKEKEVTLRRAAEGSAKELSNQNLLLQNTIKRLKKAEADTNTALNDASVLATSYQLSSELAQEQTLIAKREKKNAEDASILSDMYAYDSSVERDKAKSSALASAASKEISQALSPYTQGEQTFPTSQLKADPSKEPFSKTSTQRLRHGASLALMSNYGILRTNERIVKDGLDALAKAVDTSLIKQNFVLSNNSSDHVISLGFIEGDNTLITANISGAVTAWDMNTSASNPIKLAQEAVNPDQSKAAANSTNQKKDKNVSEKVNRLTNVAVSANGKLLVISRQRERNKLEDNLEFYELPSGERLGKEAVHGHQRGTYKLVLSDNGDYLATATNFGRIAITKIFKKGSPSETVFKRLWTKPNVIEAIRVRLWHGTFRYATAMNFSHGGGTPLLAVAYQTGMIVLYNAESGSEQMVLHKDASMEDDSQAQSPENRPDDTILALAFSPDNQYLATVGKDGLVRVWSIPCRSIKYIFRGHKDAIISVAFNKSGSLLATGSQDQTVILWDTATGYRKLNLVGHEGYVNTLLFGLDKNYLATGSADKTAKVWQVPDEDRLNALGDFQNELTQFIRNIEFDDDNTVKPDENLLNILKKARDFIPNTLTNEECRKYWKADCADLLRHIR